MADLIVPALGESISEAVISRWLKNVGDYVNADEPVLDLETDKITVQLPAPVAGALAEQKYAEGDTVRVGDVVGQISAGTAATPGAGAKAAPAATTPPAAAHLAAVPASALAPAPATAPAIAAVPVAAVPAVTPAAPAPGPVDGRPLSPAQRRAQRAGTQLAAVAPPPPVARPLPASAPPAAADAAEDVVPMSPLRKRIAERLVEAQHESASLTTFNEVDMSAVMELRKRHGDDFQKTHGVKLGFMSFFVKAAVSALKLYPGLNAEVRGDAIVYKKHYDLGIAVSTPRGLVVPVLRQCDRLGFGEIEAGILELAQRARDNKLKLEELMGGTFTITNGGIFGSMLSTPLLNYPQTGILGMHNIVERPVVIDGRVEVRPVMYVAMTYDHRVVDGREAVSFLVAIKQRIERPDRLLFDV
jgi:2-oxoglutarate dehydrogenase E2 component (dihydrolipoamide succinyltransferase)